jgi:hypothetical protein
MYAYSCLFAVLFFLSACNIRQSDYVDVFAVKQEMKDRKPKRILESDIMQAAFKSGESIADTFLTLYKPNDCAVLAHDKLDSLRNNLLSEIELVCSVEQCKNDIERQIFEAYRYNITQKIELSPNLQKIDEKTILYTRPYLQKDSLVGFLFLRLSKKEIIRQGF